MFEIDSVPPDDSVPDNVKVDNFLKEWSSLKREPCAVCSLPVFLAQRLRAGGRLYHRTCFRCQRCGSQLSPADSYETCSGAWVCETCPDEMPVPSEKLAVSDEPTTEHREPPMEHREQPKPLEHPIELRGHPKPLEHPIEPPPDPPPSLVAARRLLFDTDDAKLLKQDHAVNTRLVLSDHKDLSPITRTVGERKPVNITIDKESSSEQEDETRVKSRKHLVQNVYNSTIPVRAERAKDPVEEEIGPPAEKEDVSMKLVTDISVNKPLDVRENTLNVKDNGNVPIVERLSLQSGEVDKPMDDNLPAKRNSVQSDEVDIPIDKKLPFKRLSLRSYEVEKPFKRHSLQSYEIDKPIDDKLPLKKLSMQSDEVDKPSGDELESDELDKSRNDEPVEKPSFQSKEGDVPMIDELPTETPSLQSEEANKSGDNELLKERLYPHDKVDKLSNDELPVQRFSLHSEEVDKSRGEELSYYHTIPGMSESKQEIEESAELILEEAKNSAETVEAINTEVEMPVTSKEGSSNITPESSVGSPLKSIIEDSEEKKTKNPSDYPDDLNPFGESEEDEATEASRISTNPFGSDSEDDEPVAVRPPPRAAPRKPSLGVASTASTNPFGSDEDEEEDASASAPVPAQRRSMQSSPEPTPFPRRSKLRTSARSITSLSSIGSYSSTSPRKKRPAPPPPTSPPSALLTPSSRHPSVSSLASVRSRKTKRAPLPPNLTAAAGLPPRPKSPEKQQDATSSPSESQSIPKLEVSGPSVDETTTVETTKEVASQIEEGIKKMIVQHEDDSKDEDSFQLPSKQEKDSVNENSRMSASGVEAVRISEITEDKTEDKPKQDEISLIVKENEINKSVFEEKYHSDVILNKQNLTSLDNVSCKKDFDSLEEIELKDTKSIVETFNEDVLMHSRNSSVIHFDEVHSHSTPVKIIPSAALLNSSQEDVASGHSLSGTPYLSSPSASCADTSSYQESLASPPTEKRYKDTANMHRKISESGVYIPHKSVSGQWKRKKGPAPALPLPQRRNVKPMAIHRIRQELSDIEIKQQELERQGVALEQKIRLKFDSETSITPYLEELVLQLFELVNEKNELFRKQAELMYMRRQHQLEEEHAELEYQIRCLMARPELNKTDSDKELEEKLIQRLVEVVERRDAIVQCLEMDRIRETEEDRSINRQLDKFTQSIVAEDRIKIKKKHKKKKDKHNTLKMLDLDKDLDESEKDSKKKKKWYTLHHRGSKHT